MRKHPSDFPGVEDQALPWPEKPEQPTDDERKVFTAFRLEMASWIRKDFDVRMTPTVKVVAEFLLECVNSETLQCFPSYRTILESCCLGKSEKTVERAIKVLRERGWLYSWRPDRNSSNRFVFLRNDAVIRQIADYQDVMRQRREEDRLERHGREQTPMSGRGVNKRTQMSVREQTPMSGKSFNTIHEPVLGIEGEGNLLEGNSYASVRADEEDSAFPIPENAQEAEMMMADICAGYDPSPATHAFLLGCLKSGTLSRSRVDRILKPTVRSEAA